MHHKSFIFNSHRSPKNLLQLVIITRNGKYIFRFSVAVKTFWINVNHMNKFRWIWSLPKKNIFGMHSDSEDNETFSCYLKFPVLRAELVNGFISPFTEKLSVPTVIFITNIFCNFFKQKTQQCLFTAFYDETQSIYFSFLTIYWNADHMLNHLSFFPIPYYCPIN